MTGKINISFFIPSLAAGGAERIMSYLSQNLDRTHFNTTLVVLGSESETKYDVSQVRLIFFNKKRTLFAIPNIIKYLIKQDVDIAFSALRHLNVMMGFISILLPQIKFVGREVNVESKLKKYPGIKERKYPSLIDRFGLSWLDAIIAQSNDMKKDILAEYPKFKVKTTVINNPITNSFVPKDSKLQKKKPYKFVTVGSLEQRKGHDRILGALSKFEDQFEYTIVGDGSQREHLFNIVDSLGLSDKVKHIPYTNNVSDYLENSQLFIQGSYVEGFPNALLESCAVGTPVVAFKAPGGINEIIVDGVNGYIVKNEEELIVAINKILDSTHFTPKEVSDVVFKKYSSEIIVKQYQDFFIHLLKKAMPT